MQLPELVCPAGNLPALKAAFQPASVNLSENRRGLIA